MGLVSEGRWRIGTSTHLVDQAGHVQVAEYSTKLGVDGIGGMGMMKNDSYKARACQMAILNEKISKGQARLTLGSADYVTRFCV